MTVEAAPSSLDQLRNRLRSGGFTGLYFPRECACELEDLAPCGIDVTQAWSGCRPGHRHAHPSDQGFIVSTSPTPPAPDEWTSLLP